MLHLQSYTNDQRSELVDHLGLQELSERVSVVGDRRALGLTEDDCLLRLDDEEELRLLEISEQAGGGMYGPWRGNESKLWMALCSIGITTDVTGRGGSYGYGKAGLIRGSQVRLVIAYTCFRERDEDPGVTRRLLGMTYWDGHKIDGTSYTGSARLGMGGDVTLDEQGTLVRAETAGEQHRGQLAGLAMKLVRVEGCGDRVEVNDAEKVLLLVLFLDPLLERADVVS